jgi:arabinofuranan 3-O-arabinosyltransferase
VSGSLASTTPRSRRAASVEHIVLAAATLVLAAAVIGVDFGQLATDTRPDLYLTPGQALADTLSAWAFEPYLGSPSYQSGLAPAAMVTAALDAIALPAWLVMRVLRLGLLVVAGWGARRLYLELSRDSRLDGGWAGGVVAAIGYVANPFVVVLGGALPLLLPYALLPWLVLALRRALSGWGRWRHAALFALAFFAMGGENAGVVPLMLVVTALPAVVVELRLRLRVPWRALLGGLARCGLLAGGVSLYWVLPSLAAADVG